MANYGTRGSLGMTRLTSPAIVYTSMENREQAKGNLVFGFFNIRIGGGNGRGGLWT